MPLINDPGSYDGAGICYAPDFRGLSKSQDHSKCVIISPNNVSIWYFHTVFNTGAWGFEEDLSLGCFDTEHNILRMAAISCCLGNFTRMYILSNAISTFKPSKTTSLNPSWTIQSTEYCGEAVNKL